MNSHRLRFLLAIGWVTWVLLYAGPLMLVQAGPRLSSAVASHVLQEATRTPAVLLGAAANLLVWLAFVTLVFGVLCRLGLALARPLRLSPVTCCTVLLLAGWTTMLAANARAFPSSVYSTALPALGSTAAYFTSCAVLTVAASAAAWIHRQAMVGWVRRWGGALTWAGLAATGLALVWFSLSTGPRQTAPRNVILIGVDSLSQALMQAEPERLPELTRLLRQAERFDRAYSPLGRTFPAWMSILSGKSPADHGAVFNLRDPDAVRRDDLLSRELQTLGYRTVYGIDERRFNTLDESYGFDQVIGPRPGLLDLALQSLNDTPLTNALLQTRLGRWLLPDSAHNVAAVASYDAAGFVDELLHATDTAQPVFLAAHFLSGHFPFSSRHASIRPGATMGERHLATLGTVDRQVGALMAGLAASGRLNDALLIVLSDHGEALGHEEPYQALNGARERGGSFGHGANLLSEHANRIVLAGIVYRDGVPVSLPRTRTEQASLIDLRAMIAGYVRHGDMRWAPSACIPVETGLRLASAADYRRLDAGQVAEEGLGLYRLDSAGRITLREEVVPALIDGKDIGWRCSDRLTVRFAASGKFRSFILPTEGQDLPREVTPDAEHVAAIAAYRARLRDASHIGRPAP